MRSPLLAATALIACFAFPAQALDLGGKDRAGGNNGKGKAGIGLSIDRNGVSASIGQTEARVGLGNQTGIDTDAAAPGDDDGVSNGGRSTPLDAIHGRLDALSDRDLVDLCLAIEDPTACSEGDKSKTELLRVIGPGLNRLSEQDLTALCSELGCESYEPSLPGQGGPAPGAGIKESDVTSQLNSDERDALSRRCLDILKQPGQYDTELLNLCVLMQRI
jgi:hypothetical protein